MPELYISSLVAALAAVALVALSLPISLRRRKAGVSLGHGDDDTLHRLIRAHGNFVEYAPVGLLVLAIMEMSKANTYLVWLAAAALVLGRAIHALGMFQASTPMRATGMILTFTSLLVAAGAIVFRAFAA